MGEGRRCWPTGDLGGGRQGCRRLRRHRPVRRAATGPTTGGECVGTVQPKEEQAPPPGGRMYVGGMPDLAVKIHGKPYDAGNPWNLARCRHMALVGCGESFSAFRRNLT